MKNLQAPIIAEFDETYSYFVNEHFHEKAGIRYDFKK